ncbi:MAG TPA: type II toxin-antitoxin system VapC family toxin [Candidatus Brocadiia bacterium]|nr:PIN domain-containing protein [Candidatus Brocadiales bacterium]
MSVFVDTSALLAVLDADDRNHKSARETWKDLISRDELLVCTNYVLIETFALVQHRLGMSAVRTFQDDICPVLIVEWVDESTHRAGVTGVLTALRKNLSLVDCVSFVVMRRLGIKSAFVFDPHFKEQGFSCIP